mgnify:CR=1 FL=1
MHINRFALAILLVGAQSQILAATHVTGSAASSNAYVEALATNSSCPNNNVTIYIRGAYTGPLSKQFTVKCNIGNFAGTTENEVRFDVSNGSLSAILKSKAGSGEASAYPGRFLVASTLGCTPVANLTYPLQSFASGKLMECPENAPMFNTESDGGFMDIEPAVFFERGLISKDYASGVTVAPYSQVFGVVVNKTLYEALQADQGLKVGDWSGSNQPSVGRAQIVSLINSVEFNDAKVKGPKFLVSSTNETRITYCRYPIGSEVQVAAELYFLQNPIASGPLGGAFSAHGPENISANFNDNTVIVNGGSGNQFAVTIRDEPSDCMMGGQGFRFGIMSAASRMPPKFDGYPPYLFVKIGGQSFGSFPDLGNVQNATKGQYDFVYEGVLFNPLGLPVLDLINERMGRALFSNSLGGTAGLFRNVNAQSPQSSFGRGSNSAAPYSVN